jgi:hypothetical protein
LVASTCFVPCCPLIFLHGSASLIRSHRSDSRGRLYGKQVQHFQPQATPAFDLLSLPFRFRVKEKMDQNKSTLIIYKIVFTDWLVGAFFTTGISFYCSDFIFFLLLSTLMDDKGVIL